MSSVDLPTLVIGAIPGVLALLGLAAGYGRLTQRVKAVEESVSEVKNLSEQVVRIDERTKHTEENTRAIAANMTRLTDHILDEARTFASRLVRSDPS